MPCDGAQGEDGGRRRRRKRRKEFLLSLTSPLGWASSWGGGTRVGGHTEPQAFENDVGYTAVSRLPWPRSGTSRRYEAWGPRRSRGHKQRLFERRRSLLHLYLEECDYVALAETEDRTPESPRVPPISPVLAYLTWPCGYILYPRHLDCDQDTAIPDAPRAPSRENAGQVHLWTEILVARRHPTAADDRPRKQKQLTATWL